MTTRKKLIEVALPLDAINVASAREKSIRHGHPSTLHLWWARRPLAAARAVIFAQMVDDPSANPDLFPTEKAQEKERQRLFGIIKELVEWENTTNEAVLERARAEIWQSWRRACAQNAGHPRASELFDRNKLPAFHDPFAGGGALPLEAQRLGLESYASDLNPVAVLINKAMIEIPPRFAGRAPVNPQSRADKNLIAREWKGARGLAEDVRHYGQWMRDEAERRIGHLYPKVEITAEMARERPDLKQCAGQKLTVIAWLWARTVKSPNPAFADVDVPLASTFMLSTKAGKEAWVEVVPGSAAPGSAGVSPAPTQPGVSPAHCAYSFIVKSRRDGGGPGTAIPAEAKNGTKLARGANFRCVMSGTPIAPEHIYGEANAGRMGARLMAIVAEGVRGRVYLAPTPEHEAAALAAKPEWKPEVAMPENPRWFSPPLYGLKTYGDLFTPRQLVALTTFSDLAQEARERVRRDAGSAGVPPASGRQDGGAPGQPLRDGGTGATAYAEAVGVYLGMTVSRQGNRGCTLSFWDNTSQKIQQAFGRQALPMTWDFCESNPFSDSTGNWLGQLGFPAKVIEASPLAAIQGIAKQQDAQLQATSADKLVSTDPPYYDNIGYADLSDFFYVWLRRALRPVFPDLFATLAVPKAEELVATPYRHGSKEKAEKFFLDGMTQAMHRLAEQAHPAFPVTIYYAFKQQETKPERRAAGDENDVLSPSSLLSLHSSTGWETFLDAVIRAGFAISGTWPMRTEYTGNLKKNVSALASSIVLVCRPRAADLPTATRREFVDALRAELPPALRHLQAGNIAPVDLAQAAIGPGMAVYTRYARVLDAQGQPLGVCGALTLINQTLDEALAEQEGDFDADSRWALTWFEQAGFAEGEFGVADVLARAKNTSVAGLAEAGILESRRGKVRLLEPRELPADWNPATDPRLTAWEMTHHLIRALGAGGEGAAAALVASLGTKAEVARELAYRLYTLCERKKRAAEALAYNGLVQSWPEIVRLAQEQARATPVAADRDLFADSEET